MAGGRGAPSGAVPFAKSTRTPEILAGPVPPAGPRCCRPTKWSWIQARARQRASRQWSTTPRRHRTLPRILECLYPANTALPPQASVFPATDDHDQRAGRTTFRGAFGSASTSTSKLTIADRRTRPPRRRHPAPAPTSSRQVRAVPRTAAGLLPNGAHEPEIEVEPARFAEARRDQPASSTFASSSRILQHEP
jgi:hypothetical protein